MSALALVMVTVLLSGCAPPPVTGPGGRPPLPATPSVDIQAYVDAHAQRIEQLQRLYSNGVIELEWIEEDGRRRREPQINLKLWLDLPRHSALRGEKLGDVLLWIGSDEEQYWLFNLAVDETSLVHTTHDRKVTYGSGIGGLTIEALDLIDLLGLSPMRDAKVAPPESSTGRAPGWVVIDAQGAGGPMRLHFAPDEQWPSRIETRSASGARIVLASDLDRYQTVDTPGVSIAARPSMATRIRIEDPRQSMLIALFLDEPSGADPSDRWDRVFDLDRLRRALRPDFVNGVPE